MQIARQERAESCKIYSFQYGQFYYNYMYPTIN